MGGRTLVEKVIAKAAGLPSVRAGDLVTANVDLAFAHDSSGPRRWRPLLEELGVGLWDPSKVAIVSDHYVPAVDAESAAILKGTRDFARDYGVSAFFDMVGICHLVLPEHGLIRPGAFIAGGDSHTPTAGAFGAYAAGYGATDMAAIAATGETWLAVPQTIRVEWTGAFQPGVTAKDVMLFLCRELGMDNAFKAVEFAGPLVEAMPMAERMVLANMAAELGAETGVVAPDATTFAYLAARGAPVIDEAAAMVLHSDPDAIYAAVHRFDASDLAPQIAAPHSPANTRDATEFAEVRIDQAYIGACVGAKIEDLRMAADVLRGRRVAPGVRLLVAPGSARTAELAAREGVMETLLAAGAVLMPSGCGACAGMGAGILAEGETCISSTNRNFQGRMGHAGANVYLGSPYAVAAAAAAGRIVDPRPFLKGAA
ncbi:3-isopropylmalate dehydratase [Caulobacter vibrioides]|nr:3-isopropylmalate dehydratase [Caulobacter vibrioides]